MKSLNNILEEHEDCEFEVKAAQGRNGRGEIPRSVWESYSAMANTVGGVILLGVEEDAAGIYKVLGLKDVERIRKSAWDNLNNRQIVSTNLLTEQDLAEVEHEGLRLLYIRADFTDRISILVIKREDYFGFRNPGGLRLPAEVVLRGGESDCRNRRLQKMFQLVGAAEQAGSGFPKIMRAWSEQHWRYPLLDEKYQPEQTVLRLPTTSLLPPEAISELDRQFGRKFRELGEIERLAVVTAFVEEKVTNQRLHTITDSHARDLTAIFKSLVNSGFLIPDGFGRGTCYRLPGRIANKEQELPRRLDDALFSHKESSKVPVQSSEHLPSDSEHLPSDSEHLPSDSEHRNNLILIATPVNQTRSAPAEQVRSTILLLCQESFLSLRTLADLLNRSSNTLRVHYLSPMIKSGLLEYRYAGKANHPQQGYRTTILP